MYSNDSDLDDKFQTQAEELSVLKSELLFAKAQYNDLYVFAPHCYFTINQSGIITDVNLLGASLLGFERAQLIGKSFFYYVSFDSEPVFRKHFSAVFNYKNKETCEIELLQKGKKRCYVSVNSTYLKTDKMLLTTTDITALKKLDSDVTKLKKSLFLYEFLFQYSNDALAVVGDDLCFTVLNDMFVESFSRIFSSRVTVGSNFMTLLADFSELKDRIFSTYEKTLSGGKAFVKIENESEKDDAYYCYEMHFHLLFDAKQEYLGVLVSIKNMTAYKLYERRQLQQQAVIRHAVRMNAMGGMAAALAHEINQPLAAINIYSRACLLKFKKLIGFSEQKELLDALEQVAIQAEHAGTILHRMKNFMREGTLCAEMADINELIKQAFMFYHYRKTGFKPKIKYILNENLPPITLDKTQITQIILNLAQNSIEAFEEDGNGNLEIIIESKIVGNYVEVHFRDNGPGIPPDISDKILNSFFTTKSHGTGLGLAICRTLIEAHGGKLTVKQSNEKGAWFCFSLPIG